VGGFLKRFFAVGPGVGAELTDVEKVMAYASAGANLALPREITHELHLPTEAGTRALLPIIDRDDRVIHALIDPKTGESRITVKHTTILTPDLIERMRAELENAARSFGGTYVGWDSTITP